MKTPILMASVAFARLAAGACPPSTTVMVPENAPSIQTAINAAPCGATISIAPGIYHEAIDLGNKSLVIRGRNPSDPGVVAATIIDAGGVPQSVVRIRGGQDASTRIEGLTLTGGRGMLWWTGATYGGGLFIENASPTISDCVITLNSAGLGAGAYITGASAPRISHCRFDFNSATVFVGGLATADSSETLLDRCTFIGNASVHGVGGVSTGHSASRLINCVIAGNTAPYNTAFEAFGAATVVNCAIVGNFGGVAIGTTVSTARFINCTLASNQSPYAPFELPAGASMINCIAWGNGGGSAFPSGAAGAVTNCDVQGGWPGVANIDADPHFTRVPSPGGDGQWGTHDDDYGDLRLAAPSPCIDAGYSAAIPADAATDLAGNPRIHGGSIDMGAFERTPPSCPADFNLDGEVGTGDLCYMLARFGHSFLPAGSERADLNGDGVVNTRDLVNFLRQFGRSCL